MAKRMTKNTINMLLVVEDNPGDARLLHEMFKEQGTPTTTVTHVESMGEAEQFLAAHAVDIIVLDLGLPDAQGMGALQRARTAAPRVPLVVLTGLDDEVLAAQALQEGAQDYLIKGQIETRGLLRSLRYAIERKRSEEALRMNAARFLAVWESADDAMVLSDPEGIVLEANPACFQIYGYRPDQIIGQPYSVVLPVEKRA